MMGSMMSEASGVVGEGEGDLEQAVVDEDDIGGSEDSDGRVGGKRMSGTRPAGATWPLCRLSLLT